MTEDLIIQGQDGPISVVIRPIAIEHLTDTLTLQAEAVSELGEETYSPFSEPKMIQVLSQGQSLGAFRGDALIAKRLVEAPKELNVKLHAPLNVAPDELTRVANLCGLIVSPKYRRTGLGRALTSAALDRLRQTQWLHVYSTVALTNYPTFRNLFGHGFLIRELTEMHGGKLRYIFHQQLDDNTPLGGEERHIEGGNLEEQYAALTTGFVGTAASQEDGKLLITFRKLGKTKHNQ